ncbi:PspC domain-containing protein [Corallincola platygyrae]|uniref:PspC domain-containing protein n=1 Tax=Corallincola platygyrae TaxID=1193278 RepID=A0ABW4XMR4_9GAMM
MNYQNSSTINKEEQRWILGVFSRIAEHYQRPAWIMRLLAVLLFAAHPILAGISYLVALPIVSQFIPRKRASTPFQ